MPRLPMYESRTAASTGNTQSAIPSDSGWAKLGQSVGQAASAFGAMRDRQNTTEAAAAYQRYQQDVKNWYTEYQVNIPDTPEERELAYQEYQQFEERLRDDFISNIGDSRLQEQYRGMAGIFADQTGNTVLVNQAAQHAEAAGRVIQETLDEVALSVEEGEGSEDFALNTALDQLDAMRLPPTAHAEAERSIRSRVRVASAVNHIRSSTSPAELHQGVTDVLADANLSPQEKAAAIEKGNMLFQREHQRKLLLAEREVALLQSQINEAYVSGNTQLAKSLETQMASQYGGLEELTVAIDTVQSNGRAQVRNLQMQEMSMEITDVVNSLNNPDTDVVDSFQKLHGLAASIKTTPWMRSLYSGAAGAMGDTFASIRDTELQGVMVNHAKALREGRYDDAEAIRSAYEGTNIQDGANLQLQDSWDVAEQQARLSKAAEDFSLLDQQLTTALVQGDTDAANAVGAQMNELAQGFPELMDNLVAAENRMFEGFATTSRQAIGARMELILTNTGATEQTAAMIDEWYAQSGQTPADTVTRDNLKTAWLRTRNAQARATTTDHTAVGRQAYIDATNAGGQIPMTLTAQERKGVDLAFEQSLQQFVANNEPTPEELVEYMANSAVERRFLFRSIKNQFSNPPTTAEGLQMNLLMYDTLRSAPETRMFAEQLPNRDDYALMSQLVEDNGLGFDQALEYMQREGNLSPAEKTAYKSGVNEHLAELDGIDMTDAGTLQVGSGDDPFDLGGRFGWDVTVPRSVNTLIVERAKQYAPVFGDPNLAVNAAVEVTRREYGQSGLATTQGGDATIAHNPVERVYFGDAEYDEDRSNHARAAIALQLMIPKEELTATRTEPLQWSAAGLYSNDTTVVDLGNANLRDLGSAEVSMPVGRTPVATPFGTWQMPTSFQNVMVPLAGTMDGEDLYNHMKANMVVTSNPTGGYRVMLGDIVIESNFVPDIDYLQDAILLED